MKSCCMTCEQLVDMLTEAIAVMSPKEKAQLRVELRRTNNLPPMPEPDLYVN